MKIKARVRKTSSKKKGKYKVPVIKNVESTWDDGEIYTLIHTYEGDTLEITHASEHVQGTFDCWEFLEFCGKYMLAGQLMDITLIE